MTNQEEYFEILKAFHDFLNGFFETNKTFNKATNSDIAFISGKTLEKLGFKYASSITERGEKIDKHGKEKIICTSVSDYHMFNIENINNLKSINDPLQVIAPAFHVFDFTLMPMDHEYMISKNKNYYKVIDHILKLNQK